MKMHSYTNTNHRLREEWKVLNKPKRETENLYPANISFRNFTHFMWVPTLVYET
jgi:sterol O-acyltransferase